MIFPGSKIGARPHILTAIGSAKLAYQDAVNHPKYVQYVPLDASVEFSLLFAWWIFYNYRVACPKFYEPLP